jgi:hypothetical protein
VHHLLLLLLLRWAHPLQEQPAPKVLWAVLPPLLLLAQPVSLLLWAVPLRRLQAWGRLQARGLLGLSHERARGPQLQPLPARASACLAQRAVALAALLPLQLRPPGGPLQPLHLHTPTQAQLSARQGQLLEYAGQQG